MLKEDRAFQLMTKSFEKLKESDLIGKNETLKKDTVLLGGASPLDSIGFVTFITDLEENIINETNKDYALVLDEITEFNLDKPSLSADVLAKYIVKLTQS